jgi:hypothetical protein
MRYAGTRPHCAALLAAAVVLSGCSSASTPDAGDTGAPSRFSSVFSGSAGTTAQAASDGGAELSGDCPKVDIRTGAGTLTLNGKAPAAAATDVRYQLNFTDLARQCALAGPNLVMKVGVQGRIIVGAAGGAGPVDIPLRYAVVREGVEPRTIVTRFKRVAAEVAPGQSNVAFSDVEDNLSFPIPSRAELASYVVYVGFDEIGDASEKKPAAKKPAAKRQ